MEHLGIKKYIFLHGGIFQPVMLVFSRGGGGKNKQPIQPAPNTSWSQIGQWMIEISHQEISPRKVLWWILPSKKEPTNKQNENSPNNNKNRSKSPKIRQQNSETTNDFLIPRSSTDAHKGQHAHHHQGN